MPRPGADESGTLLECLPGTGDRTEKSLWCRARPAARRTQWAFAAKLTGDCRYCLNFNELLGVAESGNSDERAGHVMHTESLTHHIPH